jgi:hypothetical protein
MNAFHLGNGRWGQWQSGIADRAQVGFVTYEISGKLQRPVCASTRLIPAGPEQYQARVSIPVSNEAWGESEISPHPLSRACF